MNYMVPLYIYTHNFEIEELFHYIKELYKFFSQMNKKYPTFFFTWLNNFLRVPYLDANP
jgi:hypothetical protein